MLTEIYALDASNATITGTENAEEYQNKLREEISKSGTYKSFVTEKLMPAEIASSLIEIFIQDLFYGLIIDFSTFYDTQKK
jgi:hydroxymethylglutaryl-CoA synthase